MRAIWRAAIHPADSAGTIEKIHGVHAVNADEQYVSNAAVTFIFPVMAVVRPGVHARHGGHEESGSQNTSLPLRRHCILLNFARLKAAFAGKALY
jgi:hypothetical protein